MIPVVILLFVPLAIQHVGANDNNYQKKNRLAVFLFFVILEILVMLRHESIGSDTRSYISIFENYSKMSWSNVFKSSDESAICCNSFNFKPNSCFNTSQNLILGP